MSKSSFPPISPKVQQELRPLLQAIVQSLEAGEGFRGDPMDRKITQRDMVDYGLASLKVPGNKKTGLVAPTVDDLTKNLSTPPGPTGLTAVPGSFGLINLSWGLPSYVNHGYTNIHRSNENNFSTSKIVAKAIGGNCADFIPLSDDSPRFFYWVSFVSTSGVQGAVNASNGVSAERTDDSDEILGAVKGKISFEHLSSSLIKRVTAPVIEEVAGPVAGTGDYVEVLKQFVYLDGPGILDLLVNARIQGPADVDSELVLLLNGEIVFVTKNNIVNIYLSHGYAKSIPEGNHILSIQWKCLDTQTTVENISILTKIVI